MFDDGRASAVRPPERAVGWVGWSGAGQAREAPEAAAGATGLGRGWSGHGEPGAGLRGPRLREFSQGQFFSLAWDCRVSDGGVGGELKN